MFRVHFEQPMSRWAPRPPIAASARFETRAAAHAALVEAGFFSENPGVDADGDDLWEHPTDIDHQFADVLEVS